MANTERFVHQTVSQTERFVFVHHVYQKGRLLSMQGHPEYHMSIADELLERRGPILFGEETYEANSRLKPYDGAAIAAIMLEFLLE